MPKNKKPTKPSVPSLRVPTGPMGVAKPTAVAKPKTAAKVEVRAKTSSSKSATAARSDSRTKARKGQNQGHRLPVATEAVVAPLPRRGGIERLYEVRVDELDRRASSSAEPPSSDDFLPPSDPVSRLVATAVARIEQALLRRRADEEYDEDEEDNDVDNCRDLCRDLAVVIGVSYRASDWEGADEPDPLTRLRAIKPLSIDDDELVQGLSEEVMDHAHAYAASRPEKSLVIASSSDDAVTRATAILQALLEDERADIAEWLEPTVW